MSRSRSMLALSALLLTLLVSGCGTVASGVGPQPAAPPAPPATTTSPVPAPSGPAPTPAPAVGTASVFTMNNSASGNAVLAFARLADGSLAATGTYPTGGRGTGGGLQNQAGVAISTDGKFLFAVNAGSDDFTVFKLDSSGLSVASRPSSSGAHPISVAEHGGIVYVLNLDSTSGAAGSDSVSGFAIDAAGQATPIPNSTRSLSAKATSAAQVALSPDGSMLLVTERGTATIDAYVLDAKGNPSAQPILNRSVGSIPFGFQFLDDGHVLVSEEGPNAVSSYIVGGTGALTPISRSVPSFQSAVCWLAISPDHRFAYTGNTSGSSVSGYAIHPDASVSLLVQNGLSAATDGGALDLTVSSDSRYLYVVLTGGTLETFSIDTAGGLRKVQSISSLGQLNGVIAL